MREHIKNLSARKNITLEQISDRLGRTRNSIFIKLKKETIKVSYLPQLAEAIGCTTIECIPAPDGFEHKYDKAGKYIGCLKINEKSAI